MKKNPTAKLTKLSLPLWGGLGWGFIFLLFAHPLSADTITGRVVDAETGEPLEEAEVTFKEEAMNSTSFSSVRADSLGRFQYTCQMDLSRLTITASYFGYYSQSVLRMGNNDRDTITIDDFRLKMDEHLLGEVVVEGRKSHFYMRGDTVVFNPEAFQTQDGARLLELIEQLPGVTISDGKLLWNGEPLKLMMNGRATGNEGMLTNLLPVEAVKDIKAYDKQSELAARTGVADGKEEHILDVTIKPSFMDKFYGNVEASGYTSENYSAELRAMRLGDTDRLLLYGRASDNPFVIYGMGALYSNTGYLGNPVRQQMGTVGYSHEWKPAYEVRNPNFWSISASANHTDRRTDSWENRQSFMVGSPATETDQTASDYQHELNVPVDFGSYFNLSPNARLTFEAYITYRREHGNAESRQQTFSLGDASDKINASDYHSLTASEGFTMRLKPELYLYFGKTEANAGVNFYYNNRKHDGESTGNYQYFQSGTTHIDRQYFHAPTHNFTGEFWLKAKRPLGDNVMVSARWQTSYQNNSRDEQRHRADTLDRANSLMRKDNTLSNFLQTEANITLGDFSMKPALDLTHRSEQSDYRRGRLDTLATRSAFLVTPSLEMNYKFAKQTRLTGRVSYDNQLPDLIDCIGYRDDTNPLYITIGNPNLKTSHTLNANMIFSSMIAKANQVVSLSVNYDKNYDPIGTVLHYNTATGGYLARKQNVRGGERWSAELSYERDLGRLRLRNNLSESLGQSYGIMTLVDDGTGLTYNRQRSSNLTERLDLDYTNGPLTVKLNQGFEWQRHTYSDETQPRQNIYNYHAELTAKYDWQSWSFELLPTFRLDRGYIADLLNTNRFLLNASISYKFLKNKARLILYANDIFDSDTRYHSNVTATTRSEGGSSFFHNYISLTFNYKFDAKK